MSRMALELEKQVKEMRAKSAKERPRSGRKAKEADVNGDEFFNQDEGPDNEKDQLTDDSNSGKTDDTNLSQQGQAAGGNTAAGANGKAEGKSKPAMAKKSATKKAAKGPKAPKAAKPAKAAKGERKPREKKVASGKLKKIEASGTTYLKLEFEEGAIVLTPTGNREQNRDIAVKALRALL